VDAELIERGTRLRAIARAFGAEKGAPLVVREEKVWSSARRMKRDSFPME